jgi:hypothetical protein
MTAIWESLGDVTLSLQVVYTSWLAASYGGIELEHRERVYTYPIIWQVVVAQSPWSAGVSYVRS